MDNSLENIQLFKDFTGCTRDDEALHYLEACTNNLQQAIDQYFLLQTRSKRELLEKNPKMEGPSSSRSSIPIPIQKRERVNMEVDDDIILSDDGEPNYSRVPEDDDVRAPIAPIHGPLVQGSFRQTWQSRTQRPHINPVFEQYHDFRDVEEEQFRNIVDQRNGQAGPSRNRDTGKAKTLAQLFRPPIDLMFVGDWEAARAEARNRSAWLVVNVQKAEEFASQILNRDVWANPAVKDIIKSNFVLWQVYFDSPDGARIRGYYSLRNFPAVFIVDPRIGEAVMHIQTADPMVFLEQLTTFLEQYPTYEARDRSFAINGHASTSNSEVNTSMNGSSSTNLVNRKRISSKDELQEGLFEEHIAKKKKLALKLDDYQNDDVEALCHNGNKLTTVDKDDWKKFIGPISHNSKEISIVLRMPDGRREQITLYSTSPLKALFVFIDGQGFSSHDYLLVLSFPKRIYSIEEKEKTLVQLRFNSQELIDVEKK